MLLCLVLYGNHGSPLQSIRNILQYSTSTLPNGRNFWGFQKLWDHIQYALWKETFGVSSQTKSPDGLSKCLFTQMYSLGRSLHTYNVHSGRFPQFCPHLVIVVLGIQIRNMKRVFNFYGTWRGVTFEKQMMKIYDFFYLAKSFSHPI